MSSMKQALMIAVALGGVFLLARKRSGDDQPTLSPPLTKREYEDRLANLLEHALSYRDRPMWDKVSEECRKAGREDLPGRVRRKFPALAESFDRA
jgi:hypothetical protein